MMIQCSFYVPKRVLIVSMTELISSFNLFIYSYWFNKFYFNTRFCCFKCNQMVQLQLKLDSVTESMVHLFCLQTVKVSLVNIFAGLQSSTLSS